MKLLMPAALLIGSTLIAAALYVGPGGSSLQHKVSDNLCEDLSKRAAYEASKIATILKHTGVWDEPAAEWIFDAAEVCSPHTRG